MLGSIIGLILVCIILGVVYWAVQRLLALIPLAEPFRTIVDILMVVIMVLIVVWFIVVILSMAGIHVNTFSMINSR